MLHHFVEMLTERMKILIFHTRKGQLSEECKTFNFHQTQTQSPVPSCTVTRSPTSQAASFIRNTCWFPREPPIASQRRRHSNGLLPCGVWNAARGTRPLSNSYKTSQQNLDRLLYLPPCLGNHLKHADHRGFHLPGVFCHRHRER